ncbi:MAG: hypothetical protein Q9160_000089 [Pyrenula sp. 1 TL-2023]
MGVNKQTVSPGNGTDRPKKGDSITMEYTGFLYDANAPQNRGKQFDSSVGRGPFDTKIGVGQVIRGERRRMGATEPVLTVEGWDEGVPQMTLGEKAVLTISG